MRKITTQDAYDDSLLAEGSEYTVGTNDGAQFKRVIFIGTRLYHGKPMMVFKTRDSRQVTINPSFHSFVIEEPLTEMNEVLFKQSGWSEKKTLNDKETIQDG